jgi:Mu transposase, C-terminal domain
LGRDHWVRVRTCDYSVHPRAIGRRVDIGMDLEELVVACAGEEVARHKRSWAKHRTITDPAHELARQVMRISAAVADDDDVEVRDLSVYDRATGVA